MTLIYFAANYFTGEGINENVLFHLLIGLAGSGFSEYIWLIGAIAIGLMGVVLMMLRLNWVINSLNSNRFFLALSQRLDPIFCNRKWMLALLVLHPMTFDCYRMSRDLTLAIWQDTDTTDQFQAFFKQVKPIKPEHLPNLIFIFAESLERTYFRDELFPGLMNELNQIPPLFDFDNIQPLWSTGWTSTGMVSALCGLPLVVHRQTPSRRSPQSICLSDLLADWGYRSRFLQGSSSAFFSAKELFAPHGFEQILSLEELKPRLAENTPLSPWGLYDEDLLELVKKEHFQLSQLNQPWALFFSTLDTHHPKGHLSPD